MNLHRMLLQRRPRNSAPRLGHPSPAVANLDGPSSFVFLNSRPAILS